MTKGLSRSGFDIDLRHGESREVAFAKMLTKVGYLVEHKSDQMARRTGRVFMEHSQKGRPSGIAVTEADWWAMEFDGDAWVVLPIDRMRRLYEIARKRFGVVKGGDYNQYEGVLIPLTWLTRVDYLVAGTEKPETQQMLDQKFAAAAQLPIPLTTPALDLEAELDAITVAAWGPNWKESAA